MPYPQKLQLKYQRQFSNAMESGIFHEMVDWYEVSYEEDKKLSLGSGPDTQNKFFRGTDGRTDGRTDRRTDGRTNRPTNGHTVLQSRGSRLEIFKKKLYLLFKLLFQNYLIANRFIISVFISLVCSFFATEHLNLTDLSEETPEEYRKRMTRETDTKKNTLFIRFVIVVVVVVVVNVVVVVVVVMA